MKKTIFFLLFLISLSYKSQILDGNFNPQDIGFNGSYRTESSLVQVLQQPDGKLLCVGNFYGYNGIAEFRVIRLNQDGTRDLSFLLSNGADNVINKIALQEDNKIIVVGSFSKYNGANNSKIVRLNIDGTVDDSFYVDSDFISGGISSVLVDSDKILIGGAFFFNNLNYVVRLNNDGSFDSSFNTDIFFLRPIFLKYPGNKYIIANGASGTNGSDILRLNNDGTVDSSFNKGSLSDGSVYDLKLTKDNKIYLAGNFKSYNSVSRFGLARINNDGSLDNSFNPEEGADNTIESISVLDDNSVLIGGFFIKYNTITRSYIAKVKSDGSLDNNFNIHQIGFVQSIQVVDNSSFILTGQLGIFYNIGREYIAKYKYQFLNTNDNIKSKFSIYPNPFTDRINFIDLLSNLEIYDFSGRKVYSSEKETKSLDIESLNKGIYILSGTNKEGVKKSYKIEKK